VAQRREGWECHIQSEAGHAFDNHEAPMFSVPEAAARAWDITREFLARNLR
jgi:carboxymethylenebutenolidase